MLIDNSVAVACPFQLLPAGAVKRQPASIVFTQ